MARNGEFLTRHVKRGRSQSSIVGLSVIDAEKLKPTETMKNLPKIFLSVAVISFAIGLSEFAENSFFYMGRPVGAISFVLFMIFQFLKNETALYDAEQQATLAALRKPTGVLAEGKALPVSASRGRALVAQSMA
jgi:hypothetical protein